MTFTLGQISEACNGRLIGDPDTQITGISTDSRNVNNSDIFIALKGSRFDGHDFIEEMRARVGAVVTEREFPVPPYDIVVPDTYKALGDIGRLCRDSANLRLTVGITGSVGKTTTKELVASVLKERYKTHFSKGNFNNHIGLPLTLCGLERDTEALVCEMGMSNAGEIEYLTGLARPDIALITNIGVSHLENLGTRENIRNAKLEILKGMKKGSVVILDGDEPLLRDDYAKEALKDFKVVYSGFGIENDIYPLDIFKGSNYIAFDAISPQGEIRITIPAVGDHFVKNALFAYAAGIECGVPFDGIARGIAAYLPGELRQKIYVKDSVRVIADCYNASPESMTAALNVLGGCSERRIAVLGDMLELGLMSEAAHRAVGVKASENADYILCYGTQARLIMRAAVENGFDQRRAMCFDDIEALSRKLKQIVTEDDCVLFKASRRMKLERAITLSGLDGE